MSNLQVITEKPEWLVAMEEAGDDRGKESISRDDLITPRLAIAQKQSEVVDESSDKYIPGCSVGDIYNTQSHEVYKKGLVVQFVDHHKEFRVVNRGDIGSGVPTKFYGSSRNRDESVSILKQVEESGEDKGLEIEIVYSYLLLAQDQEGGEEFPIYLNLYSSSSTQAFFARSVSTELASFKGASFSRRYKLSTSVHSSKAGQRTHVYSITFNGYSSQETFKLAEKLYDESQKFNQGE